MLGLLLAVRAWLECLPLPSHGIRGRLAPSTSLYRGGHWGPIKWLPQRQPSSEPESKPKAHPSDDSTMLYSWSQTFFHVFAAPVFLFLRTGVNLFCVCVYIEKQLSAFQVFWHSTLCKDSHPQLLEPQPNPATHLPPTQGWHRVSSLHWQDCKLTSPEPLWGQSECPGIELNLEWETSFHSQRRVNSVAPKT